MSSNVQVKSKDLFAPDKEKRKRGGQKISRLPPAKTNWWKKHGSWVEIHNIVTEK